MLTKRELSNIIKQQRAMVCQREGGLQRCLALNQDTLKSHALDIRGVRRCGKSTMMSQLMFAGGIGEALYLSFDSTLLSDFSAKDFKRLDEVISEAQVRRLYFDEVQEVLGWELYVRQKLDEGYQVCVSGSNASLLEGDLATKLTGRHISREMFPFSYQEFLTYKRLEESRESTMDYLRHGGFPRYLDTYDEEILLELFDDIIYRDIIAKNHIRESASLQRMVSYLAENVGCRFASTKVLEPLSLTSSATVLQWCDYIEKAYLFFFVPAYKDSIKAMLHNPRKVYSIDTGLQRVASMRIIPNEGLRFENMVFLALRRHWRDIYYVDSEGECDFVVMDRHVPILAIQVCYELDNDNLEREIRGLRGAMKRFGLKTGTIVTLGQEDSLDVEEGNIRAIPFHLWNRTLK